jgi:N-acetyl sugar amidotransferase
MELCNRYRKGNGEYDVIVPCSGGKDGGFVAHQLKYKYGMNPLTVTWAPLKATDIGRRNLDAFIGAGFDNVLGTPNGKVTRKLTRLAFNHLGDPFQPFIYGQTNFPLHMAVMHNVQLIMYGENGEVEYGGDMKNAFRPDRDIEDHDKHYFSGLSPEFWTEHGLSAADLKPFMAPRYDEIKRNNTVIHFFGYYKFWDPQENFYYCKEHTGFAPNTERSEGTYSKYASLDDRIDGYHYYLAYIKFGIGRTTSDTAHEIRDGKIDREEGIALVKRYDGEFPRKYFQDFLDYCDISEEEFNDVIDSWRSDHLWEKVGDAWQLRKPIWEET